MTAVRVGLLVIALVTAGAAGADALREAVRAYRAGEPERSVALLRPQAEAGDPRAQQMLGYLYLRGRGTAPDAGQALAWYLRAARAGLASAQYQTGLLYELGSGVAPDPWEAEFWYAQAVGQGYCPGELDPSGALGDD